MSAATNSDSYRTVTPYLVVPNVAGLIEFLKSAFGAVERLRVPRPDGSVGHAEVTIGDSIVMMGEPFEQFGPVPGAIFLTVADCDATYARAIECGATSIMEPSDMVQAGQRYGGVKDLCGNLWWPATPLAKK
jgi:PhnB protein